MEKLGQAMDLDRMEVYEDIVSTELQTPRLGIPGFYSSLNEHQKEFERKYQEHKEEENAEQEALEHEQVEQDYVEGKRR